MLKTELAYYFGVRMAIQTGEGTIFTLQKTIRLRIHTTYMTFKNVRWLRCVRTIWFC